MAQLTLRLTFDPDTGKKNLLIDYQSDADALPMEHEADHRAWVDRLLANGTLTAAELGEIQITRDGETTVIPQQDPVVPEPTPVTE